MPRPLFVALLALASLLPGCRNDERRPGKPPIILISIDTLRADHLPAYGSTRIATPAIDRLAADGIVFENAYAHVPLTLPSHVTMMSGTLPWQTGVRSNIGFRFEPGSASTLPKFLAERGYATGAAISAYVVRGETGLGPLFEFYDDSLEVYESATLGALQRSGDETVRAASGWLDRAGARPVFLFLHLFEPHTPYEPPEPFRSRYANPYDGEIAATDAIVGRFFADLERRGIYDDALIILVSDHGEGLGDHGEPEHGVLLYREVLHVPLIVKLPRRQLAGRRVSAPAQMIDLFPTIVDAIGDQIPAGLSGTSLIDIAEGRASGTRTIYSETLYPRLHLGWSQLRSLTDARHHYIESPAPELFDVVADPAERRNLREEQRRQAHALANELSKVPLNLTAPGAGNAEERARLAALGYLSGAASESDGPLRNPVEHIDVLARVQQTFALNQKGRYRESVELCREILRDYPDLVDVYYQLAANLRRLGRFEEALAAYHEGIRRSPQLVDSVAIEVAKLELEMNHLENAELNARQAMKLNPDEAHLLLAAIRFERGQWKDAEREARLALGSEQRPRVPALIMLARILVEEGKLREALATIDQAAARVTEDRAAPVATVASTRGDILARMGRAREAEVAFREEIERFPLTRHAYVRLAILLAEQHRFSEIQPTLEAMIQASPEPSTYRLAARAMSDLGNEEAARGFRQRADKLAAGRKQS